MKYWLKLSLIFTAAVLYLFVMFFAIVLFFIIAFNDSGAPMTDVFLTLGIFIYLALPKIIFILATAFVLGALIGLIIDVSKSKR